MENIQVKLMECGCCYLIRQSLNHSQHSQLISQLTTYLPTDCLCT